MAKNSRFDPLIIRQQIELLYAAYPEIKDDDVLRADMLEGATDLHEVLRTMEHKRREATIMSAGIAYTVAQLEHRRERFDRRDEAIRGMMLALLQTAGVRSVELPEATISTYKGPAKVIISDESKLPEQFWRVQREPNKKLIKETLANGDSVPGVTGMSNAPDCLKIKVK